MKWTKHAGPSALSGVTGDPTIYTVHILSVADNESLDDGFIEFWRKLLGEMPDKQREPWEILLLEFWTDAGMFSGIYTTPLREYDASTITKISSDQILREFESLPDPRDESDRFDFEYNEFENRYWAQLCKSASVPEISELLQRVRASMTFRVWGTFCHYTERMRELPI